MHIYIVQEFRHFAYLCYNLLYNKDVHEEETRMMNGSTAQILEPAKDSASLSAPKPHLNGTTKRILQLLLNYIVSVDHEEHGDKNTGKISCV